MPRTSFELKFKKNPLKGVFLCKRNGAKKQRSAEKSHLREVNTSIQKKAEEFIIHGVAMRSFIQKKDF